MLDFGLTALQATLGRSILAVTWTSKNCPWFLWLVGLESASRGCWCSSRSGSPTPGPLGLPVIVPPGVLVALAVGRVRLVKVVALEPQPRSRRWWC